MVATKLARPGDDFEKFKEAMIAASEKGIATAEKHLKRTKDIFEQVDAESLVAIICTYGSMSIDRGGGADSFGFFEDIQQHHLELLLSLYANMPAGKTGVDPVSPQVVQEMIDILGDLGQTFLFYRMRSGGESDNTNRAKDIISERVRMHTQAVRNWAYFDGVERTLEGLFGVHDDVFKKTHGFAPQDVLSTFRALMKNSEDAIATRFETLSRIAKGRRPIDIFRRYFKFVPDLVGTPEELADLLGTDADRSHALSWVMAHYDLRIPEQISLSLDELAEKSGVDKDSLVAIVESLTIRHTDNKAYDLERVFLSNDVWLTPMMVSKKVGVISPVPMLFFSHSFRILDKLYREAGRQERLAKIRSEFLENELERVMSGAFPSGALYPNSSWSWQGVQYETDLIVAVDSALIICEAKSHHLKDAALRGAENALKKHVRQIIGHSSEQSGRLSQIVELAKVGDKNALAVCKQIGFEVDASTFVVRISVSLEDMAFLNGLEKNLQEVGWVDADLHLSPFISIHDLDIVCDILRNELFILHYLYERQFFERLGEILGDEVDFLGVYIDNLFNFVSPDENAVIYFSGMSGPIDRYYLAGDRLPKPKVHPFIRPIIKLIMERRRRGWSLFGMSLLAAASWSEFDEISEALRALRRGVRNSGGDLSKQFMLQIFPPESHRAVLLFILYREKWRDSVRELVPELTGSAAEQGERNTCVAICQDVDSARVADAFYFAYVD